MRNRALAVIGTAVLLALSGCTTPEPATPTPTAAFSTEEEAFAAAEETYRAYVDALNQVDLSDPETFEGVYEWTTGEANADERKTLTRMHADGWMVSGETEITTFFFDSYNDRTVQGLVCTDVTGVTVTDSAGTSVVSTERPDAYALSVAFAESSTATGLAISSSSAVDDARCGS